MNSTNLIIRIDPALKDEAQVVADRLGLSVSAVINNELRRFVKEQHVIFHDEHDVASNKTHRRINLRVDNKTVGMLSIKARREGLHLFTLINSLLKQAADKVPRVYAPVPAALPVGHFCDKCALPLRG